MNENLLQYLWSHKLFREINFRDVQGQEIEIIDFGKLNPNSGPDFSFAKIKTKNLEFAGDIEIHVKSSDWYFHHHPQQKEYQSVILHVVYFHDLEIEALNHAGIPTLELKGYIDQGIVEKHKTLQAAFDFIPCEYLFEAASIPFLFAEEKVLKKLDEKSLEIDALFLESKNDYEAVLFQKIAYSFGVKVNAAIYQNIAENIDFKIIQKISQNQHQLESLLLGMGNVLAEETPMNKKWKREFEFLKSKFSLPEITFPVKFLRLMPPSFPTIRLSQLAHLYHLHAHLFSEIILAESSSALRAVFEGIQASAFWENHYTFERASAEKREKKLSEDFIDLVMINAVLPILYTYFKNLEAEKIEQVLAFYKNIKPEKNTLISQWKKLGVKFPSALETQAFLYHHKHYCSQKKCLNCEIGLQLLKKK